MKLIGQSQQSFIFENATIMVKIQVRVIPDTLNLQKNLDRLEAGFCTIKYLLVILPVVETGASLLIYKQTAMFHVPHRQLAKGHAYIGIK